MRLFFHHRAVSGEIIDEVGLEVEDLDQALAVAIANVRRVVSNEASRGRLDLRGRVDVADYTGNTLSTVRFEECFTGDLVEGYRTES